MLAFMIIFCLSLFGILMIAGIDVKNIASDVIQRPRQPPTAYELSTGQSGNKLVRSISRIYQDMHVTLESAGVVSKYPFYCTMSVVLAVVGGVVSILINNLFLLPPLSLLGLCVPLLLSKRAANEYKKKQSEELQVCLSIVTSSFLRTHDILSSIADNLEYLHGHTKSVFKLFLRKCTYVTADIESTLYELEGLIQNEVWVEWCETMILCLHDHTKETMLEDILKRMQKTDKVQIELDTILSNPMYMFIMMIILMIVNFITMLFISKESVHILLFTIQGKIACALSVAGLLFAMFSAIRATSPVEYKR